MTTTFEGLDSTEENDQEKLLGEIGQLHPHLLEQLRGGLLQPQMKILEIGCGYGNNIRFFIKHRYQAFATDQSEESIQLIREYLPGWNPVLNPENFQPADPLALPFDDGFFDYAFSLHFSGFTKTFQTLQSLIGEALRVIKPSGVLFLQLETSIGLEGKILHLTGNRYLLQDGHEKFLLSEQEVNEVLNNLKCSTIRPMITVMNHAGQSNTILSLIKN